MNLPALQEDAAEVLALLARDPEDALSMSSNTSVAPLLIYTADDLRGAAYSVMAGDPAQPHLGSDRRSPFAKDHDGRSKAEALRRAQLRDQDYFARMLLQPFGPGYRTWLDKETGLPVDIPTPGACRPIDVMTIARYLPAVLAHRSLSRWVEAQDLLLPTQVAWRDLDLLARKELLVREGWSAVDVTASLITQAIQAGRPWIVQADLPDAYGQLPHAAFREVLGQLGAEALDRLAELARIDAIDRAGTHWRSAEAAAGLIGIAQGSPVSPLLLSVALSPLLRPVRSLGAIPVAHGDDIYLLCESEAQAHAAFVVFLLAAQAVGIPVRPLGTTGKASRIIDARDEPVIVCRTYVVLGDLVALTPRRLATHLDALQRALSSSPPRSRVPAIVRTVTHAPLASRRWMRAVGMVAGDVDRGSVLMASEKLLFGLSSRTTRDGTPSPSGQGRAEGFPEVPGDTGNGERENGPHEGPESQRGQETLGPGDHDPGKPGAHDAEVGGPASAGPDPAREQGREREQPKGRKQARGKTTEVGEQDDPTRRREPVEDHHRGHPSSDDYSRYADVDGEFSVSSKLEDAGIPTGYPSSRSRQRHGKARRAAPAAVLRVTPEQLPLARARKRIARTILDLSGWCPVSREPHVELGLLLRAARWCRMVTVLVHPGQRWVHERALLGNALDPVYDRVRERATDDGLLVTLRLRAPAPRCRRRVTVARPAACLHVTLRQGNDDRRLWTARLAGPDHAGVLTVRTRRTDAQAGRLEALEQVIRELPSDRVVAVEVGVHLARLLGIRRDGPYRHAPLACAHRALWQRGKWRAKGSWIVGTPS